MSWVWSWFSGILSWLGLHNKKASILFLGLDNAGKTTLMDSLAHGHVRQHQPTQHTTSEDFTMGNIQFTIFDLGGHKEVRRAWRDHFAKADAIIYLVDAADPQRFQESRTELNQILSDDQLAQVPVLVLGNKIDARSAVSEQDFRYCMGLALTTGKRAAKLDANIRPLEVFMCSILMGQGYREGFQWLSKYIN